MDSLGKCLLKNSSRMKNKIFWKSVGAKHCPNSIWTKRPICKWNTRPTFRLQWQVLFNSTSAVRWEDSHTLKNAISTSTSLSWRDLAVFASHFQNLQCEMLCEWHLFCSTEKGWGVRQSPGCLMSARLMISCILDHSAQLSLAWIWPRGAPSSTNVSPSVLLGLGTWPSLF